MFWLCRFEIDCVLCTCWVKCSCGCQLVWWEKNANVVLDHVMSRNVVRRLGSRSRLLHVSPTLMHSSFPRLSQNLAKRLSGTCACVQIVKDTPRPILWRSSSAPQLIRLDGQPFVRFVSLSRAWCYVHVGFWARFSHTSLLRQQKITISARFIKDHEKLLTKVKFVTWAAPSVSL